MNRDFGLTFALTILIMIPTIGLIPIVEAKVTVHSVTVTTDKSEYPLGTEAIARAELDFTGAKKDLLGVNFTWYYPNGTVAKSDLEVMPDGGGVAYSSWWLDEIGNNYVVNATYSGDETKFDETSFDVIDPPLINEVSGPITVDTIWRSSDGPYIVVGDLFVELGVTLTIEPGVVVEFYNDTVLKINGTIIARGTETNMITFTSNNTNPEPGDWQGIEFNNAHSSSEISYARIEYSNICIDIFDSSPTITNNLIRDVNRAGIQAYKSSSYIAYNTITHIVYDYASNKGINLLGECDVTIYKNTITDVQEYGIKIKDSEPIVKENYISGSIYNIYCNQSNSIIEKNTLTDAADGIWIDGCEDVLIANNTISDCYQKGIRSGGSSLRILNNLISGNGDSGIYLYHCQNVFVLNNNFEENERGIHGKSSDILVIFGNGVNNSIKDGIYLEDCTDIDISNNIIDGNENGINIKDTDFVVLNLNIASNNTERALFAYNSIGNTFEENFFSENKHGVFLYSASANIANCTFSSSSDRDIYLTQNSGLIAINSSFHDEKLLVSGGCELTVKNYLHIFVQNSTFHPFQGAEVEIRDGEKTIYSILTDDEGYCRYLLLTDRTYSGSTTPIENISVVEVNSGNVFLLDNPREVDMSYSHLEVFSPGNPLSLEIVYPANNSLVFEIINITGTASSQSGQIIKVEVSVGGGEWFLANRTGGDWSFWWFELDTQTLADGYHNILVRVSTQYHTNETSIEVLVDNIGNKPPMVSITSHNSHDAVNGTIVLEGTAFDYDGTVNYVDVRIDFEKWKTADKLTWNWSEWSIEIDTTDYSNGEHNISVMAVDNATESMVITIVLVFDNKDLPEENGETDDGIGPFPWWTVLGALLLIIAIIMILILIGRKRGEGEKREEEGQVVEEKTEGEAVEVEEKGEGEGLDEEEKAEGEGLQMDEKGEGDGLDEGVEGGEEPMEEGQGIDKEIGGNDKLGE
ncbi:MAG: right-handed parallel beta-helix repeat-containing protein [Methanomassiliicoccales archaeon]|nr:MAG: right-handed parallel beta-helix repeat-containing protein [Methanomassiliicoccales archaeon]